MNKPTKLQLDITQQTMLDVTSSCLKDIDADRLTQNMKEG